MAAYLPRQSRSGDRHHRFVDRQHRPNERHHRLNERLDRSHDHQRRTEHRNRPGDWQYSCGICQEDHALRSCPRFRQLTPSKRYEVVERRGYCRNCLARSHLAPDCPTLSGCRDCATRHHTMLHGAPQLDSNLPGVGHLEPTFRRASVFIPTVTVQVAEDNFQAWASVRALLCQSSVASRIASSTFRRLGLTSFRQRDHRFTTFRIKPRSETATWMLEVTAVITDELPRQPYADPILEDPTRDFGSDTLADIDPQCNTPIDLELGADVYPYIRREGIILTRLGKVEAHHTHLGRVFLGPTRSH